jgi:hypothetical protein
MKESGSKPSIEVLGIYRIQVTESLFEEQFEILYSFEMDVEERREAERACREQLDSTVLVELIVTNPDKQFDVGAFTQPDPGLPKENWQAPYLETFLSLDGESLADENDAAPLKDKLRVAFFMHCWQPSHYLRTSYRDIICPKPQPMPDRLRRLVPYEPVD